jgi:hypothetical protein
MDIARPPRSRSLSVGDARDRARLLWKTAVKDHPDDLRIVENAAWFLLPESQDGLALVKTYCAHHPADPDAWALVAAYAGFLSVAEPDRSVSLARESLDAAFQVFRVDPNPEKRLALITDMRANAKTAQIENALRLLDAAERASLATEMLEPDDVARTQLVCVAVAFIGMADTDLTWAVTMFRRAATLGFPTDLLLTLASQLANRGESSAVLEVLRSLHDNCVASAEAVAGCLARVRAIPGQTGSP